MISSSTTMLIQLVAKPQGSLNNIRLIVIVLCLISPTHNYPIICRLIAVPVSSMDAQLLFRPRSQFQYLHPASKQEMHGERSQHQQYEAVLQFGWDVAEEFEQLSLRGAIYIDCILIQQPSKWLLRPDSDIQDALNKHIVRTSDNQEHQHSKQSVLVYNRNAHKLSMIPACRLALVLLHLDLCHHVDILVDGLQGFMAPTTQELTTIRLTRKPSFELIFSLQDVECRQQHVQLVDVRTRDEYEGRCSGYSYHPHKGHIHGALYHGGTHSKGVSEVREYGLDGTFVDMWKSNGISVEQPVVLYCGTGWRASQVLVLAVLRGVKQTSLYSNGWVEWSEAHQK